MWSTSFSIHHGYGCVLCVLRDADKSDDATAKMHKIMLGFWNSWERECLPEPLVPLMNSIMIYCHPRRLPSDNRNRNEPFSLHSIYRIQLFPGEIYLRYAGAIHVRMLCEPLWNGRKMNCHRKWNEEKNTRNWRSPWHWALSVPNREECRCLVLHYSHHKLTHSPLTSLTHSIELKTHYSFAVRTMSSQGRSLIMNCWPHTHTHTSSFACLELDTSKNLLI